MIVLLLGALAIGLCLGFLGAGGSILTVPIVHYMIGHEEKVAIAESLAIVGGIALLSSATYARAGEVDWPGVLFFGLPGMAGTYGGATLARFASGSLQLIVFGVVMLVAAWMMYNRREVSEPGPGPARREWRLIPCGVGVGVVTGFVGVGGGFLIVPGLVLLGKLPMRIAVGTSLVIIGLNSASGFVQYLGVLGGLGAHVDWWMIGLFILVGVVGGIAGARVGARLNQVQLRRAFAAFLLIMSVFILAEELPGMLRRAAQAAGVRAGVWRGGNLT